MTTDDEERRRADAAEKAAKDAQAEALARALARFKAVTGVDLTGHAAIQGDRIRIKTEDLEQLTNALALETGAPL